MARTNNNSNRANGSSKRPPEAFPPLISDDTAASSSMPPPYTTNIGRTNNSGVSSHHVEEYYHPASFPGYTVVQITTGQENQPLLPRLIRPQQQQQQRRRRSGGCCRRLCFNLCGCLCLMIFVFVVLGIITGGMGLMRGMFPSPNPSESWSCSLESMEVHTDRVFAFPMGAPLRIESTEGINLSRVHLVRNRSTQGVTVRAMVETGPNRGTVWGDRITVVASNSSSDAGASNSLVVRAARPYWAWPFGCVRTTLYIGIPAEEGYSNALSAKKKKKQHEEEILPLLHVRTATGTLAAIDLGALRVNAVDVGVSNGNASIRNVTSGALVVRTTNGAIRMRSVKTRGGIELRTTNGPIAIDDVAASSVAADTSNASIKGDIVISEAALINTSNGAVDVAIQGISSNKKTVSVTSSNAQVSASVAGIGGNFLVRTSNSHAEVTSSDKSLLRFTLVSNTFKQGTFSLIDDHQHPDAGSIIVGSSNGRVSLGLSP